MKSFKQIIAITLLSVLVSNCTLLKKRYSPGYKVEWNKSFKKSNTLVVDENNNSSSVKVENEDNESITSIDTDLFTNPSLTQTKKTLPENHILSNRKKQEHFTKANKKNKINITDNSDKNVKQETLKAEPLSSVALSLILTAFLLVLILILTNSVLLLFFIFPLLFLAFIFSIIAKIQIKKHPNKYTLESESIAKFVFIFHLAIMASFLTILLIFGIFILLFAFYSPLFALFILFYLFTLLATIIALITYLAIRHTL